MELRLSVLVNFVLASDDEQLEIVTTANEGKKEYRHWEDFYREFRVKLPAWFQAGDDGEALDKWILTLDAKKRRQFKAVAAGVKKFVEGKHITWMVSPKSEVTIDGVTFSVKPELGLFIDDVAHAIKIRWKDAPPLTASGVAIVLHVMKKALAPKLKGVRFGLLDTRTGELHTQSEDADEEELDAAVTAVARRIATLAVAPRVPPTPKKRKVARRGATG